MSGRWQCVVAFDFCRVSTWGKWSCMAYTPLAFGHHHFGDSFPPPSAALPLPGLHLHALNPRDQSRKYTVKKHSIITTGKKGGQRGRDKYKLCMCSAAGSIHVRARQCNSAFKDSPVSLHAEYGHFGFALAKIRANLSCYPSCQA